MLLLVLVVAACGGGASEDAAPQVGPLERMLQVVPDTEVNRRSILIQDYARIRELNGMPTPSGPANAESVREYLVELSRFNRDDSNGMLPLQPPLISLGVSGLQSLMLPETIGYSFLDVDQDILVGVPPNESMAARGRIDSELVNRVIRDCDTCPVPEEVTFNGVSYFSWGDDFELNIPARLSAPAFDELGRGGRVVAIEGIVMRALWTEGIEGMIDAYQGAGSLADNPDVLAAVRALDERGAFAAYGTDQTTSVESITNSYKESLPGGLVWPPSEDEPLLRPYRFVMAGAATDDDGQFFWLILVHGSPDAAEDNAGILPLRVRETTSFRPGEPWADFLDIEQLEVSGRLLIAKLRGVPFPGSFSLYILDPLLLHEDPD